MRKHMIAGMLIFWLMPMAHANVEPAILYVQSLQSQIEYEPMDYTYACMYGECPVREQITIKGSGPVCTAKEAIETAEIWFARLLPEDNLFLGEYTQFRAYYDPEYRVWLVRLEWIEGHENAFLMEPVYFWISEGTGDVFYYVV